MRKIRLIAVACFAVSGLWAGPVSVTITNGTLSSAGAAQYLTDKINSSFQVPSMGNFLKSMSNAQSITAKGQGVSYASEQSLFVVGGSVGLGLNNGGAEGYSYSSSGGLPPIGVGVLASGMVGVSLSKFPLPSLGPVDLKRFTVFVNYFSYSNDTLVDSLTMKTNSFGIHLQYQLIDRKNIGLFGLLNWGGVALTSGFDVTSNSLKYKIGQSVSTDVSGSHVVWTPDSSSSLDLTASVFTIPIEVSTSVRLAYILSFFVGAGIDLNMGKSTIGANMSGVVSSTGNVNDANAGTASLNINQDQGPTFGAVRFFGGPQINLVPLKNTNVLSIYVQGNYSTGGSMGANGGVRLAW